MNELYSWPGLAVCCLYVYRDDSDRHVFIAAFSNDFDFIIEIITLVLFHTGRLTTGFYRVTASVF